MTLNKDIKVKARKSGVLIWEIADRLGIADTTMSRRLRYELSDKEKELIVSAIDEISLSKKEKDR